jgi:hypothetical protein
METVKPYNKYLIAALVLKALALFEAGVLIAIGTSHVSFQGFFIGLLFLVPNYFLIRSRKRVKAYLAATAVPMGYLIVQAVYYVVRKPSLFTIENMSGVLANILLCTIAPLSLLALRKGLRVAKERGVQDPSNELWLVMGGGSDAIFTAGMMAGLVLPFFVRIQTVPVLAMVILLCLGISLLLVLLFIKMGPAKAMNLGRPIAYFLYSSYAVIFAAMIFFLIRRYPFWLPGWTL